MEKAKKILELYNNPKDKIRVKADIYPMIFRDDEWQRMKDTGIDTIEFNEFQHGILGDKSAELILNYTEEFGLDTDIGLFKALLDKHGITRGLNYDYKKHPNIKEIHVYDEPDYKGIDLCRRLTDELEEHVHDLPVVTNLFPAYVPESYLGSTYEEYVDKAFKELIAPRKNGKIISCDFYPFEVEDGVVSMNEKWVYNHKIFADYAKEYGAEIAWCIQTCNYFLHRIVRTEDILMQIYMALAFGVKQIILFSYGTPLVNPDFPEGCNAMIGHNYQPTSMYFDTQEAIKELRKIERVCKNFDYNGAKSYIGKNNAEKKSAAFSYLKDEMQEFKHIKDVEAEEDTVVTEMYDAKNGLYGYYVINYNDPFFKKTDKVKIKLKDADATVALIKGEPKEFAGDALEIELAAGEGIFIIPYKK